MITCKLTRHVLLFLVAVAADAGATAVRMNQIDLIAGQTLVIRLDAAATRNLDSVAIVTTSSGRIVSAPGVTATLSAPRDGARWLRITARADAPKTVVQAHGVARGQFSGVIPVAVRVVETPPRGIRPPPSTQWSRTVTVSRSEALKQVTPYRAISKPLTQLSREAPLVTVELGSLYGNVRSPDQRDLMNVGVVEVVTHPNTQVTGIAPENGATTGGELVISGTELPAQVGVRLANGNLSILSASPTTIRARLPNQPVAGPLVLVRQSDGAEAVLDDNYPVTAPSTAPLLFDGFNSTATSFDWKNAYLLSLLSWLAYADSSIAASQAASWGLTLGPGAYIDVGTPYFIGSSGSTQALVLYNDATVFVAFQGSTTGDYFQDWLDNDFDVNPQIANHWGLGVVLHHGFAEAMAIAYTPVLNQIQPLLTGGRRLWITGHSLGGAVAVLTAYKLRHENNISTQGMQVFGAPPVGNLVWSQVFASKVGNVQRWNLQQDPVPSLLPPPAFAHVGSNNNLYTNGNHQLNDSTYFIYLPNPSSLNDLMVTHMNYWCRLHEEVAQNQPAAAQGLPPPPPLDSAPCED